MSGGATRVFLALLAGCGGGASEAVDTSSTTDPPGQCGAVTEHDVTVRAKVVDDAGAPVEGVELRIEEDYWHSPPRSWGSGVTGADGIGEFEALGIVSVEDCWGIAVNYTLWAQLGDRLGSDQMYNSSLFEAIRSETFEADSTGFPIVLPP